MKTVHLQYLVVKYCRSGSLTNKIGCSPPPSPTGGGGGGGGGGWQLQELVTIDLVSCGGAELADESTT